MTEYTLVEIATGNAVKSRKFDKAPPDVSHKGWRWRKTVRNEKPSLTATQKAMPTEGLVKNEYVHGWTVTEMSAEEKNEARRQAIEELILRKMPKD